MHENEPDAQPEGELRIPQSVKDSLAQRGLLPPMWYVGPLDDGEPTGPRPPRPHRIPIERLPDSEL
jgi:hypothetical protein